MADLSVFLGMRYLCLLCRCFVRKTQNVAEIKPEEIHRGCRWGIAGSMLLTLLYTCVFQEQMQVQTEEMVLLALISGVGALISMVGDLAASAIKRNYGKKDYGTLIPGHGGILDRFDSVIFTAPVIYYLAAFLLK